MCNKRSSVILKIKERNVRIDPCMRGLIRTLNNIGLETLACCCGHDIYNMTIVVKDGVSGKPYELVSNKDVPRKRKFYKNNNGYYFIPEVENLNSENKH